MLAKAGIYIIITGIIVAAIDSLYNLEFNPDSGPTRLSSLLAAAGFFIFMKFRHQRSRTDPLREDRQQEQSSDTKHSDEVKQVSMKSNVKGSGYALIVAGVMDVLTPPAIFYSYFTGPRENYLLLVLPVTMSILGILSVTGGICALVSKRFKLSLVGSLAAIISMPIFGPMLGVPAGAYLVLSRDDWPQTRRRLAIGGLIFLGAIHVILTFILVEKGVFDLL